MNVTPQTVYASQYETSQYENWQVLSRSLSNEYARLMYALELSNGSQSLLPSLFAQKLAAHRKEHPESPVVVDRSSDGTLNVSSLSEKWEWKERDFLRGVDLRGAVLKGDWSGVSFTGGVFYGADLSRAQLDNASLYAPTFRTSADGPFDKIILPVSADSVLFKGLFRSIHFPAKVGLKSSWNDPRTWPCEFEDCYFEGRWFQYLLHGISFNNCKFNTLTYSGRNERVASVFTQGADINLDGSNHTVPNSKAIGDFSQFFTSNDLEKVTQSGSQAWYGAMRALFDEGVLAIKFTCGVRGVPNLVPRHGHTLVIMLVDNDLVCIYTDDERKIPAGGTYMSAVFRVTVDGTCSLLSEYSSAFISQGFFGAALRDSVLALIGSSGSSGSSEDCRSLYQRTNVAMYNDQGLLQDSDRLSRRAVKILWDTP